jgi:hypothetical protein
MFVGNYRFSLKCWHRKEMDLRMQQVVIVVVKFIEVQAGIAVS